MTVAPLWQRGGPPVLAEAGQCLAGSGNAGMITSLTPPGWQTSPHGEAITPLQVAAGGLAFTYSATGLPDGLSIDPEDGQVTGTPTAVGTYLPIVTVTDAASGVSQSAQFGWSVTVAATDTMKAGLQ